MTPAIDLQDVSVEFRAQSLGHHSLKYQLARMFTRRPSPAVKRVIDHVSLAVPEGQCVGIIGRNGAGKSTLIRVAAQIIRPSGGRVSTRGRVVPLLELGVGFHPEMTGTENCYLAGSLLGFSARDIRARLPRIAEFAELGEFMETPVKYYSSGMYARLAFSLVMDVDPDVLLLDEILGVGDEFFRDKSHERLRRQIANGITTVIVSHNVDHLASFCDRLIWIDRGRIALDGPCAEVARAYHGQSHQLVRVAP